MKKFLIIFLIVVVAIGFGFYFFEKSNGKTIGNPLNVYTDILNQEKKTLDKKEDKKSENPDVYIVLNPFDSSNQMFPRATGELTNNTSETLENLTINLSGYDSSDSLVGDCTDNVPLKIKPGQVAKIEIWCSQSQNQMTLKINEVKNGITDLTFEYDYAQ